MRTIFALGQQPRSGLQRASSLGGLPAVLEEYGVNGDAVFQSCGLDLASFGPDTMIQLDQAVQLLETACAVTKNPDLGLLLGQRFHWGIHGIIGELMQCSATLGQALQNHVSWQSGYSQSAIVYLVQTGEEVRWGYGTYAMNKVANRCVHDAAIMAGLRMIEDLSARQVEPVELLFSHRPPENLAGYRAYVKCPVRFNQPYNCIVLDAASLKTPIATDNPERRAVLKAHLRQLYPQILTDLPARLRHVMRPLLQSGRPGMSDAAKELGVHERTLRRRLDAKGTNFETVRNEVRQTMARDFLELTDMPISEIAAELAYTNPGAFSEAFRRWSGLSPTQWRRRDRLEVRREFLEELAKTTRAAT